jgi:uncharacterized protein (TIGR00661 family)
MLWEKESFLCLGPKPCESLIFTTCHNHFQDHALRDSGDQSPFKRKAMKILYGLPSEGMGHATRSKVVIAHLLKRHDVRIVTSDRAYTFMVSSFPGRVHQIRGFHLAYRKGQISKVKTFSNLLKTGPSDLIANFHKYREVHAAFKPDLVISDFESFSYLFSKHHRLPVVSIDNMQALSRCELDIPIPKEEKENYLIAKNIVKAKVPRCDAYLIAAFFDAPIIKPSTYIVPPILREPILRAKTDHRSSHCVVYQTSASQQYLSQVLRTVPERKFFVYGFNRDETLDNITFKKFSEVGFINDIATADAVVTNGGFSLISEAVYLHKPVCSVPIHGQFEQYLNGAYIDKLSYGRCFPSFTADGIKAFLYDLPRFRNALDGYHQDGNEKLFEILDRVLAKF